MQWRGVHGRSHGRGAFEASSSRASVELTEFSTSTNQCRDTVCGGDVAAMRESSAHGKQVRHVAPKIGASRSSGIDECCFIALISIVRCIPFGLPAASHCMHLDKTDMRVKIGAENHPSPIVSRYSAFSYCAYVLLFRCPFSETFFCALQTYNVFQRAWSLDRKSLGESVAS